MGNADVQTCLSLTLKSAFQRTHIMFCMRHTFVSTVLIRSENGFASPPNNLRLQEDHKDIKLTGFVMRKTGTPYPLDYDHIQGLVAIDLLLIF